MNEEERSDDEVAAFFDMDYTLLRVDAGRQTSVHALREKVITKRFVMKYLWWTFLFKINLLDFPEVFRRGTGQLAQGRSVDMVMDLGQTAFDRYVEPLIFGAARQRVEQHRAHGHIVSIVTSSPTFVVEPVRKALDIPYALTTRLQSRDGHYTGKVDFVCFGEQKTVAMRRFASEHDVDLTKSYAYTDHHSDIPMLALVGHPVCVNPTKILRKHAEDEGWEIVEFE